VAKKLGESNEIKFPATVEELEYYETDEEEIKREKRRKAGRTVWMVFRPVVIVAVSLLIVLALVNYVYNTVREKYLDPVNVNDTSLVEVEIPRNSSLSTISEILEEEGIIRNQQAFKLYADFSDMSSKLRAGTYMLSKSMDFDDIIYELRQGIDISSTVDVLFREGEGISAYERTLVEYEVLENTDTYDELCKTGEGFEDYSFIASVLDKEETAEENRRYALEGYLFPDTYQFYYGSSEETIIGRQLSRFKEVFNRQFALRAEELGMTIDEVVILASIIEKEAKSADFTKVSAVFHNRLNSEEMRLDSDATLNYYLEVDRLVLTAAELDTDTHYNTRMYGGLPPGPICNPGRAAIYAALYPDEEFMEEGYYYFTLTDPDSGELVFTKTYDEHLVEQEKYMPLYEQADREAAAAEEMGDE
jgi:UPF0755 protein